MRLRKWPNATAPTEELIIQPGYAAGGWGVILGEPHVEEKLGVTNWQAISSESFPYIKPNRQITILNYRVQGKSPHL